MNITIINVTRGEDNYLQWVGTPSALYPFYNLPAMDERTAFVIFDVDEKKKPDYSFNMIDASEDFPMCLDECDETEMPVEPAHHQIVLESRAYLVFDTSKGIRLVNRSYLAPMMSKLDELMFFERKTASGGIYIAAKLGLLLAGVISPTMLRREDTSMLDFSKKLYERTVYARQCQEEDAARRADPEIMLVDRQTGEVVEDEA